MALDWLPQEDVNRIMSVKPGYLHSVLEFSEELNSGNQIKRWVFHLDDCLTAAILTWLTDESVAETRKYFRLAGEAGLRMLEERWATWKQTCPAEESSTTLECAIISGDMELSKKVASFLTEPTGFRTGHPTVRWYASAMKDVVLGDESLARRNLEGLALSTKRLPLQQIGNLYAALLDHDEPAVQKGLETYVKWHRGRLKPKHSSGITYGKRWEHNLIDFEFYLSVPGLAFCSLAASKGLVADVDEPFLPKQLFVSRKTDE